MSHRYWRIFAALLCSLGATACQPEDGEGLGSEEGLAQTEAALIGTQSSCNAQQIDWQQPNGSMPAREQGLCEGPWEYSEYTTCYVDKANSPSCPVEKYNKTQCTEIFSCAHPDFGRKSTYTKTVNTTVTPVRKSAYVCQEDPYGTPYDCGLEYWYDGSGPCRSKALAEIAAVDDRYEGDVSLVSYHGGSTDYYSSSVSCTYTLAGYPIYNSQPDANLCGSRTYPCQEDPVYVTCRHPDHGIETDPAECYTTSPSADKIQAGRKYSAPGMSLNGLRAAVSRSVIEAIPTYAPICTTANDLPMRNPTEVRAKFNALTTQLAKMDGWEASPSTAPTNVDRPVLRRQVVTNAKLLFDLKGAQFDDAPSTTLTDKALALYKNYPEGGYRKLTRVDPVVDFTWTDGSPMASVPVDFFSVRWTGKVTPRYTETYFFHTFSDDGVRLWVNNQLVLNNWTLHGTVEDTSIGIPLEANKEYDIRLEFFEHGGHATARLLWSSSRQNKEVIPSSQLKAVDGTPGLTAEYFDNSFFDNRDLTDRTGCGNSWMDAPVADSVCTEARETNALFAMCYRMTLDHVPASSAALVLGKCVDAIAKAQASSCTQGKYAEAYDTILPVLLQEYLVTPHGKVEPQLTQALQRKLAFLDQWYRATRTHAYGGDRMATALNQRTSHLVGEFWRGAYMSERPIGMRDDGLEPAAVPVALADLQSLSDDYLKVDRTVLMAAFSNQSGLSTPPLTSAPLALIASDAFKGMAQRLDQMADGHDLGCRFRGCAASKVSTEVSQLWRLLSLLPDNQPSTVSGSLAWTLANGSAKVSADWRPVFQQLVNRHNVLERAVEDAFGHPANTYVPSMLDARTAAESYPTLVNEFVELVRDARQRTTSYDKTGAFDATLRNVLHTGMNTEKQADINTVVDTALANLTTAINDYERDRTTLVTTYLEEMRAQREQDRTANLIRQRMERLVQLETDLAGMRHNARAADARHAEFVRAFEQLASQPQLAEYQVELRTPEPIAVSAADAHYTKPEPQSPVLMDNIRAISVKNWVRQVEAGDVIRIDIDPADSWAPTCAFQSPYVRFRLPEDGSYVPVSTQGITTGPEGFTITKTTSGFHATSVASTFQNGTYETNAISGDVCAGVRGQVSTPGMATGNGVVAYAEVKACVSSTHSGQWSETESENTTEGQERRSAASFTTGLRLPNTPFPRLPVGSLLLVELKRNGSLRQDILQIHPLQRSVNTIIIDNNKLSPESDLILVANDRECAGASDLELSLTVHHTRRLGSGSSTAKLLAGLANAKAHVDTAGKALLKEGRAAAEQLAVLRQDTLTAFGSGCSCTLTSYPAHFQNLVSAWVDHELASLSRHASILAAEREMSLLAIELEGLGMDLARQQDESRLLKLLPLWALRNMEGNEVAKSTHEMTDVVNRYLFPIIQLRYPEVLTTLKQSTDASNELLALTDGSDYTLTTTVTNPTTGAPSTISEPLKPRWTHSRLATAKVVRSFVKRVQTALTNARLASDNSASEFPVLALSFPRPGYHPEGWKSLYPMADTTRSAEVWAGMEFGTKASFRVEPEDLYGLLGGEQMLCNQGSMVIRSMSLFFAWPGLGSDADTLNGMPQITPVVVNPSMTFTTKAGPEMYQHLNPKWLDTYVYPIFGEAHDAKTKFAQWRKASRKGNGLSPFTTFDFEPQALRNWVYQPITFADELILLFEVEVEPTSDGSKMTWIKSCQPKPAPTLTASGEVAADEAL